MGDDNAGLQTVGRALDVLGCFRGDVELGVTEIARIQQLPMSTTHRLLRTLVASEFVEQDPRTGRYRLGVALAEYGQLSYRRHRLYLAEPLMEQLAVETGTAISIARRYGNDVVNLAFTRWRESQGHNLSEVRFPIHASALGKAILAWSETDAPEMEALRFDRGTDRTPQNAVELEAELEHARRVGYTMNDEQTEWGIRIIGLPVLDSSGRARYALGVRGTTSLMIPQRVPFLADLARVTAARIAEVLDVDADS